MKFITKKFSALTIKELYTILQLRAEVFVVEQECIYQDIDKKDDKALHIIGYKNNQIIAYTRIFKSGDYYKKSASIGRVLVKKSERKRGYSHQLIQVSIQEIKTYFKETSITISAQVYLIEFYKKHGFIIVGEEYLEDGIPHIEMKKS